MNTENNSAKEIINDFLRYFPAPECPEQQDVVDRAKSWLTASTWKDACDAQDEWWRRFMAANKVVEVDRE